MATLWLEARDDESGRLIIKTTHGVEAWDRVCEDARDFYDCRLADIGFAEADNGDKLTVYGEVKASVRYRRSGTTVLADRKPAEAA